VERHARLWQEVELSSPDGLPVRVVWAPSPLLTGPQWWHQGLPVRVGDAASHTLDSTDAFLAICIDGVLLLHRHPVWAADALRILAEGRVDFTRCAAVAAGHGVDDALEAALALLGGEFGALPESATPGRPDGGVRYRARGRGASLRADWAVTRRNLPARRRLTGLAAFLADRWDLEEERRVPVEAGRRFIRRLSRR
jgi:hypothetical protein